MAELKCTLFDKLAATIFVGSLASSIILSPTIDKYWSRPLAKYLNQIAAIGYTYTASWAITKGIEWQQHRAVIERLSVPEKRDEHFKQLGYDSAVNELMLDVEKVRETAEAELSEYQQKALKALELASLTQEQLTEMAAKLASAEAELGRYKQPLRSRATDWVGNTINALADFYTQCGLRLDYVLGSERFSGGGEMSVKFEGSGIDVRELRNLATKCASTLGLKSVPSVRFDDGYWRFSFKVYQANEQRKPDELSVLPLHPSGDIARLICEKLYRLWLIGESESGKSVLMNNLIPVWQHFHPEIEIYIATMVGDSGKDAKWLVKPQWKYPEEYPSAVEYARQICDRRDSESKEANAAGLNAPVHHPVLFIFDEVQNAHLDHPQIADTLNWLANNGRHRNVYTCVMTQQPNPSLWGQLKSALSSYRRVVIGNQIISYLQEYARTTRPVAELIEEYQAIQKAGNKHIALYDFNSEQLFFTPPLYGWNPDNLEPLTVPINNPSENTSAPVADTSQPIQEGDSSDSVEIPSQPSQSLFDPRNTALSPELQALIVATYQETKNLAKTIKLIWGVSEGSNKNYPVCRYIVRNICNKNGVKVKGTAYGKHADDRLTLSQILEKYK